jgi:hypothetical protein
MAKEIAKVQGLLSLELCYCFSFLWREFKSLGAGAGAACLFDNDGACPARASCSIFSEFWKMQLSGLETSW